MSIFSKLRNQHGIRRVAVYVGTMVSVTVMGVAVSFAAAGWLSSGDGNAPATGAPVPGLVVTGGSSGTALTPGASTSVTVLVTNPYDTPATVISVTAGSSALVGTCAAESVTTHALTAQAPAGVPANAVGYAVTLSATMSPSAGPGCAGQSFSLPVTVVLSSGTS